MPWKAALFFAALLLLPPWLSITQGPPRVFSGDEPHYLVQLNSLLTDGDLDVSNNYIAAARGTPEVGMRLKGFPLDHHSAWYRNGQHYYWNNIFYSNSGSFWRSSSGDWIPRYRPHVSFSLIESVLTGPEFSWHPFGLAALLYPVLKPAMLLSTYPEGTSAYSELVEKLAVAMASLAGLVTALSLLSIFRTLRPNWPRWCVLLAVAAVFGTPLWHYSRALFTEIFLACFGALSFALWLRGKRSYWISLPLAAGALLKPPFLLLSVPLAADTENPNRFRKLAELFAAPAGACAAIFWMNHEMFGSALTGAQPYRTGNFWVGLKGVFTSTDHGIAWFAPVLLLAILGWVPLLRSQSLSGDHKRKALGALLAGLLYLTMIILWKGWHGGWCYGPRLVLPSFPLLLIGLAGVEWPSAHWWKKAAFGLLAALSIAINTGPGLQPHSYWMKNPLREKLVLWGWVADPAQKK